ncbi:HD domain-containing protein [Aneurinibacillus sp. Ricciae_BoGa-3]|uniref:HD domain-containing protein n=1 Tax=Aneurinibacillus sp. Ricciae_BoGa-3 TaxID=3022697 RepID=UPI002340A124|nr:HD domain-containing protein [Aneurinibacillus sp. Ricciae_BoGa-3]WCK55670.1 HD domain-containing protein [Aneurinibacillus sp. Ricciae_BoGa-3]
MTKQAEQLRIIEQLKQAFVSDKPSLCFRRLKANGELEDKFPEIFALVDMPQNSVHHKEGTAFEHTMQVLDVASLLSGGMAQNKRDKFLFSALVHDVGKAVTLKYNEKTGEATHHGHEAAGVPIVHKMCDRLGLEDWKKEAAFITKYHMHMHILHVIGAKKVADLIRKIKENVGLDWFIKATTADKRGRVAKGLDFDQYVSLAEHPNAELLRRYTHAYESKENPVDKVAQIQRLKTAGTN